MAEERGRDEWMRTSWLMAHLANLWRDPKKGRPWRPRDFFPYPWRRQRRGRDRVNVDVSVLRDVFVKRKDKPNG